MWAFLMPVSHSTLPWGWWQVAHEPSAAGPAAWFAPVTKFRSLWQEPQAAIEGYVYQLAPPTAAGAWQVEQKRTSCGYVTFGPTVESFPWCRAWKKISPSRCVFVPVMLFGLWQSTQVLMSR